MKSLPHFKWTNPVHLLALGFGTGAMPKAPGTFGTLIGVLFFLPMMYLSGFSYLLVLIALFLVGIYLCGKTAEDFGVHDHGSIVWDEVVGYLVTMAVLPFGLVMVKEVDWAVAVWCLLGFVLFRLFDIWKPWPIRFFDKKVHGGIGIMIDDVFAGVYGAAVMVLLSMFLL